MRLLADENFPKSAVLALRAAGHDVSWVAEDIPSVSDKEVLALAIAQERVLVTLDKDFGELAFRVGLPATCGIVLFRLPANPTIVTSFALRVLDGASDYTGRFVVVEERRLRERLLPTRPE